jgi:uncharacterized peroxidase-related enzyme
MPRIPLQDLDSAPESARPLLQQAVQASGYLSNLLATLANAPESLEAYLTLSKLNAKGLLSFEEREVVQLVAATTHGCSFCVAGHTAIARKQVRMSDAQLSALRDGRALDNSRLEILARFARAVIRHRGNVPQDEYEAFLAAGYREAHALQVVLGVSLATLCNFANNLGQPPLNAELHEHRWERSSELRPAPSPHP